MKAEYKVKYRGKEYVMKDLNELALFAFNTEKIELMSWIDSEELGYTINRTIKMTDAVNELQKLYDDIEEEAEHLERQECADLACEAELKEDV